VTLPPPLPYQVLKPNRPERLICFRAFGQPIISNAASGLLALAEALDPEPGDSLKPSIPAASVRLRAAPMSSAASITTRT